MLDYILQLDWRDALDTFLAALAIVTASVQFFDSRNQKRKMDEIAGSMSTRFVGVFPKNMTEIIDIVDRASGSLDIMIDICAYGHYSNPLLFLNYVQAIERAVQQRNLTVRMIIYDENQARSDQEASVFGSANFFEEERKSLRYTNFFKKRKNTISEPQSVEEFKKMLASEQRSYTQRFLHDGIEIRTVSEDLLMFMWLDDNQDAVFSFRGDRGERELSFRTRDGNLLTTLRYVFDQIWVQAKPIEATRQAVA